MTTTPREPVKVARDLTEIVNLSVQLLGQAVNDANATVDGTSLPGGRAMIALAPVGDTATLERRVELAEAAWARRAETTGHTRHTGETLVVLVDDDRPDLAADEDDETAPALQILRYWSEQYRWATAAVWDHIPTLNTEAKFLHHLIDTGWLPERDHDMWPHFGEDINRARRHLESILYAGNHPDRSRVVCNNPTCEDPKKLIRVHARRYAAAWTCTACATPIPEAAECTRCHHWAHPSAATTCTRLVGTEDTRHECGGVMVSTSAGLAHCPNPWCFTAAPATAVWASDARDDRWKCTSCKSLFDDVAFRAAHAQQLRHEKTARYVLLPEAIATLKVQGRSERTIRKWLEPPLHHQDQCTRCRKLWPHQEHPACPRKLTDRAGHHTGEVCGGDLVEVARGNPEAVVEAYCNTATHQTWVWWPDLWRLHLSTATRRRQNAS